MLGQPRLARDVGVVPRAAALFHRVCLLLFRKDSSIWPLVSVSDNRESPLVKPYLNVKSRWIDHYYRFI